MPIAPPGRPPQIAFARQTMSGVTPNSSVAPPAATAAPVLTSSKISGTPCCVRELAQALEVAVDRA